MKKQSCLPWSCCVAALLFPSLGCGPAGDRPSPPGPTPAGSASDHAGGGFAPSSLGAEMKYLPDRPREVRSVRVDQMRSSGVYRELRQRTPAAVARTEGRVLQSFPGGIEAADVARVTTEGLPTWAGGRGLPVFTTRGEVAPEGILMKLPQQPDVERVAVGPRTAYRPPAQSFKSCTRPTPTP